MGTHMKTTIELPDALLSAAKALAAERGTTLRAMVEEGLRRVLQEEERRAFCLRDASFEGRGLQPEFLDAGWDDLRRATYSGRGT